MFSMTALPSEYVSSLSAVFSDTYSQHSAVGNREGAEEKKLLPSMYGFEDIQVNVFLHCHLAHSVPGIC